MTGSSDSPHRDALVRTTLKQTAVVVRGDSVRTVADLWASNECRRAEFARTPLVCACAATLSEDSLAVRKPCWLITVIMKTLLSFVGRRRGDEIFLPRTFCTEGHELRQL